MYPQIIRTFLFGRVEAFKIERRTYCQSRCLNGLSVEENGPEKGEFISEMGTRYRVWQGAIFNIEVSKAEYLKL